MSLRLKILPQSAIIVSHQADAVDEMALHALPDAELVVATHADHVTRRVSEREDGTVVCLKSMATVFKPKGITSQL